MDMIIYCSVFNSVAVAVAVPAAGYRDLNACFSPL
jgi:hypothetical protein